MEVKQFIYFFVYSSSMLHTTTAMTIGPSLGIFPHPCDQSQSRFSPKDYSGRLAFGVFKMRFTFHFLNKEAVNQPPNRKRLKWTELLLLVAFGWDGKRGGIANCCSWSKQLSVKCIISIFGKFSHTGMPLMTDFVINEWGLHTRNLASYNLVNKHAQTKTRHFKKKKKRLRHFKPLV